MRGRKGTNTLLMKIGQGGGAAAFSAKLTDRDGKAAGRQRK